MKTKLIIKYIIFAVLICIFLNCGKRVTQQRKNDVKTDSISSVQHIKITNDSVTVNNLPENIKKYIAANYPGYQVNSAMSDPLCQGGDAIDVGLINSAQPNMSLIFKPDGTYIQKETDVPLNTAPAKVKEVMKTSYSSYKASDPIEKITLADNTTQYLIDITKAAVTKEVTLSAEGVVVCER
jgi:hypothetical protein